MHYLPEKESFSHLLHGAHAAEGALSKIQHPQTPGNSGGTPQLGQF